MRLYLTAKTSIPDLFIDYIQVKLKSGEEVSLNWDYSDIERTSSGFSARYKGVYFDEEHANGRIDELQDMKITDIGVYYESKMFFSNASQEVIVSSAVCIFIFLGMLLGIAGSNLWKAYYVKKYDIQGKSIPAYTPRSGQKQTVLHSIVRTLGILGRVLLGIIAFSVLATVVVYLFMKWLPA